MINTDKHSATALHAAAAGDLLDPGTAPQWLPALLLFIFSLGLVVAVIRFAK